jgi:8-oxo-dGTP diphosphatase
MENTFVDYKQEIKVATDCVCIATKDNKKYILLMMREYEPFKGSWAIPGGFLQNDEELFEGALRELKEETNIDTSNFETKELGVFGKVGRDPRKRIISVAYLVQVNELLPISKANESLEVKWVPLDELDTITLAFDHKDIVAKALEMIN